MISYPYLPVFTSILWILPISHCLYTNRAKQIETPKMCLLLLMMTMIFFSCLFWLDPVSHRNTLIHTMDAACARITIFAFIAYNVILQPRLFSNLVFLGCIFVMFAFFYGSDCCSREEWCSDHHIYNHMGAHLFAWICLYFTLNYVEDDEKMGD